MNMTNGKTPKFAQWNYRIMCHPIKRDIPTNRFRTVEDFGVRMKYRFTLEQLKWHRQARFQLNPKDKANWDRLEFSHKYGLLDRLMAEIPGRDNYQGNLVDDAFGLPVMEYEGNKQVRQRLSK